jgi:hypothetical protein
MLQFFVFFFNFNCLAANDRFEAVYRTLLVLNLIFEIHEFVDESASQKKDN